MYFDRLKVHGVFLLIYLVILLLRMQLVLCYSVPFFTTLMIPWICNIKNDAKINVLELGRQKDMTHSLCVKAGISCRFIALAYIGTGWSTLNNKC